MTNIQPTVYIVDHTQVSDPEILAMLQAMYSRSSMPIKERLADLNGGDKEIKEAKIKAAINQFYLNFGHASIADCANVPVFVEGVSLLAAKALQDSALYNGTERSTRYQDFSGVPFYAETHLSISMVEKWRQLYQAYLPKIEQWVAVEYADRREEILPKASDADMDLGQLVANKHKRDALWNKTVKAIAFDIARGLLPCGATTSLSMYMSLRKFRDHLTELSSHPLMEVRNLAVQINDELYRKYPNTFSPIRQRTLDGPIKNFYITRVVTTTKSSAHVADVIKLGGQGEGLYVANEGDNTWYGITGSIDFGSYRDLQRHRRGTNQMPLVNARSGPINAYYASVLKAVDPDLYQQVLDIYDQLIMATDYSNSSIIELQYAHPMMTQVPVGLFWSKAQVEYVLALRSKTSVHPTLREWCFSLYESLYDGATNGTHSMDDFQIDTRGHYIQSNRGDQDLKRKSVPDEVTSG